MKKDVMYSIRKYRETDKEQLRFICKETAWDSYKTDPNKLESVPILYNDYFTEQEPEYVFVIANQDDVAKGYIICSADYEKFVRLMTTEYTDRLMKVAPAEKVLLDGFLPCLEKIKDRPVHFHMDMLPECQRKGLGTKLIYTLCAALKQDGYTNLSACSVSRSAASYKLIMKLGFEEICDYGGDCVSANITFDKIMDRLEEIAL